MHLSARLGVNRRKFRAGYNFNAVAFSEYPSPYGAGKTVLVCNRDRIDVILNGKVNKFFNA